MTTTLPTRRRVLGSAGVSLSALGWASLARGESPMGRLRVGIIGTGVRGKYLIGNLPPAARVVAICDCAQSRMADTLRPRGEFAEVLDTFKNADAKDCRRYQDYRRMIDREKLDAVVISTPDHHHALAAMTALDAGLDVYLEKPMTLTIREGRLIADKVKATGRVLQVGSQQRSMELNRFACEFVRSGGLGKITLVELPNYPGPIADPAYDAEPVPDGLDWDMFLGPTPFIAYNRHLWVKDEFNVGKLPWRGWDLFRRFSGHMMTNWGAHNVDMLQYALGRDASGPVSVRAVRPASVAAIWKEWDHKTPAPTSPDDRRFWPVEMRYADGVLVRFAGGNSALRIRGERGTMTISRNRYEVDPPDLVKDGPDPKLAANWAGSGNVARPHIKNWLDRVRDRKSPVATAEIGHRTATVCHLANIARELARPLAWDPAREQFVDDKDARSELDRPRRRGFELPE